MTSFDADYRADLEPRSEAELADLYREAMDPPADAELFDDDAYEYDVAS